MTGAETLRAFIERLATSDEADPRRRVILEFERDPDATADAVRELLHVALSPAGSAG